MISSNAVVVSDHHPLSLKAACLGFIASTVVMTLIMVVVGNLA